MPVVAVVLAAGFGTRFDENNPKQLVSVGGKPIVCWSIEAFENNDRISDIIVVVNERVEETVNELIDEAATPKCGPSFPAAPNAWTARSPPWTCSNRPAFPPARKSSSTTACVRSSRSGPSTAASTAWTSSTPPPWPTPPPTRFCSQRIWAIARWSNPCRNVRTPSARRPRRRSVSEPSSKPTNWPPPTPTSTRPTTRAWWWTTCRRAGRHRGRFRNEPQNHHAIRHADRRRHRPQPRPRTRQGGSQGAHARRVRRSVLPDAQPLIFIER